MLKYYIIEALEPTLLYGMICSVLGIVIASSYHSISLFTAILLIVGVMFAQMAINVINDYVDYRRGIDAETTKTKFSGGSKMIVDGLLKPDGVLLLGSAAFVISLIIGIYFAVLHPVVIPLVVIGALTVSLYTSYLVDVPFLAEPLTALNFMLIGLGSFIVAGSSTTHLLAPLLVTLAVGIVVSMALLANEIPDRKVDEKHGRRTGVVLLGSNSNDAYYYVCLGVLCYALIFLGVALGVLPYAELIAFVPLPLMILCFLEIRRYSGAKNFERYMGINAIHSLLIPLLLIIGYVIVML